MPRGRPRKPTKLLIAQGTLEKSRALKDEWQPPVGAPPEPTDLGPQARKEWRRAVAHLQAAGVLTTVDQTALEGYCRTYEMARVYEKIARDEPMVETFSGIKPNPAAETARKMWTLVKGFAVEFGMTPAARTRVSAKQEDPGEADEKFLFGGGLVKVTQGKPDGVQ